MKKQVGLEVNKSILSSKWFVICVVLYKLLLDWSYLILSRSAFDYEYTLKLNSVKLLLSYVFIALEAGMISEKKRDRAFLFRLIVFFTMVPIATLYGMRNGSSIYFFLSSGTFILVEILLFRIKIRIAAHVNRFYERRTFSASYARKKGVLVKIISVCCLSFTLVAILLMFRLNGFPKFDTLLLKNVYKLRESYSTTKYLGYMISLITYVLVPFGIARATCSKRKASLLFWFLAQFLIFLWTGHKTWLFSIILLLGMILLTERVISEKSVFTFLVGLTWFGCITANGSSYSIPYVFSLFNRRVLLNAASLKYYFYDYFVVQKVQLIGVGGTILAPFFPTSSSQYNYAMRISELYTGVSSNANTGIYGGDFANVGAMAFIITPLLLLLFAFWASKCTSNCGSQFTIILFSYLAFSFNDQSIIQYFMDFKGIVLIALVLFYKEHYVKNDYQIRRNNGTITQETIG